MSFSRITRSVTFQEKGFLELEAKLEIANESNRNLMNHVDEITKSKERITGHLKAANDCNRQLYNELEKFAQPRIDMVTSRYSANMDECGHLYQPERQMRTFRFRLKPLAYDLAVTDENYFGGGRYTKDIMIKQAARAFAENLVDTLMKGPSQ